MKKKSKLLITCIVLCAVAAIGATMAYFFAKTATKTNAFTLSKGIDIQLAEPAWDNKDYDGANTGTIPTANLGETKAQNFVPGRQIPKDPSIKNVSEDNNSVWIAIKLDYTVGTDSDNIPDTYEELAKFATIDNLDINLPTSNWEANADNTIFYYKTPVQAGDTTSVLFKSVTIKDDDGIEYYKFNIDVTAYAIQAEGLDQAAAKSQLAGFIKNN